jgi:hypothetical protein
LYACHHLRVAGYRSQLLRCRRTEATASLPARVVVVGPTRARLAAFRAEARTRPANPILHALVRSPRLAPIAPSGHLFRVAPGRSFVGATIPSAELRRAGEAPAVDRIEGPPDQVTPRLVNPARA